MRSGSLTVPGSGFPASVICQPHPVEIDPVLFAGQPHQLQTVRLSFGKREFLLCHAWDTRWFPIGRSFGAAARW
jgi:hypothetical protein